MALPSKVAKTEQVITLLTPKDRTGFDQLCDLQGLSRSEMLRELVRDRLKLEGLYARELDPSDDPTVVRDDDGFEYENVLGGPS